MHHLQVCPALPRSRQLRHGGYQAHYCLPVQVLAVLYFYRSIYSSDRGRNLFATLSVSPSRPLLSAALQIFQQEVESIKTVRGLVPNFICYPLQRNALAAMKQWGGNALGIDRDEPLFIILISTAWLDRRDDATVNRMTENIISRIEAVAKELKVADRYLYINYASAAQADKVFAGYGEKSRRRLRDIQRSVDPRGIFISRPM